MLIKKKGRVLYFICLACDCEFVVGIHAVEDDDGNFYCKCPMCRADCHTDISRQEGVTAE